MLEEQVLRFGARFAGWTIPIYAVVVVGIWWMGWRAWRRLHPPVPHVSCGGCGYDVRTTISHQCPECGADLRRRGALPALSRIPFPRKFSQTAWLVLSLSLALLVLAEGVRRRWFPRTRECSGWMILSPLHSSLPHQALIRFTTQTGFGEVPDLNSLSVQVSRLRKRASGDSVPIAESQWARGYWTDVAGLFDFTSDHAGSRSWAAPSNATPTWIAAELYALHRIEDEPFIREEQAELAELITQTQAAFASAQDRAGRLQALGWTGQAASTGQFQISGQISRGYAYPAWYPALAIAMWLGGWWMGARLIARNSRRSVVYLNVTRAVPPPLPDALPSAGR